MGEVHGGIQLFANVTNLQHLLHPQFGNFSAPQEDKEDTYTPQWRLSYLGHDYEHCKDERYDNVHPQQPPQESEIRRHHRPEVGFNFFYARLPRYQLGGEVCQFPADVLHFLQMTRKEGRGRRRW